VVNLVIVAVPIVAVLADRTLPLAVP